MLNFNKVNQNPKGRKAGDCVIRAISSALGKTWDEVYQDLAAIGFKIKAMPNEKTTYERYLKQQGWEKHKQPRKVSGFKYVVGELQELTTASRVLISVSKHLTCVIDGSIVDSWNTNSKTICNYWTFGGGEQ